ncbi:MAG: diguanylate cyclase [Acidobacteria bacterium]|nr:diguanylate cyclase [Acidobacteriota bacterium]
MPTKVVNGSESREASVVEGLRGALRTLLQAMSETLFGERGDVAATKPQLEEISASVDTLSTADSIVALIGKAVGLFRRHNERAEQKIARRQAELEMNLVALEQTIEVTSDGLELAVAQLKQLSAELVRACVAKDADHRRAALMRCVQVTREEVKRQTASIENIRDVQRQLSGTLEPGRPAAAIAPGPMDPITGLPARQIAERTLLGQGRPVYVIAFVLSSLHAVTSRYGQKAADPVLLQFSQHVAQRIGNSDRLFRWGRTSFLGLFERHIASSDFHAEIAAAVPARIESFVDGRSRAVMFTTDCHWMSFPFQPGEPTELLISKIDGFVRNASGAVD